MKEISLDSTLDELNQVNKMNRLHPFIMLALEHVDDEAFDPDLNTLFHLIKKTSELVKNHNLPSSNDCKR